MKKYFLQLSVWIIANLPLVGNGEVDFDYVLETKFHSRWNVNFSRVKEYHRSQEESVDLYPQGRTKPGNRPLN